MDPILIQLTTLWLQEPVTTVQQQANWTSVVMTLVTTLPATIAAIVAGMSLLQTRRNAEVAARTNTKVEQGIEKSDVIIEKATEIHSLTNGHLSKLTEQLNMAHQMQSGSDLRIKKLEEMITRLLPSDINAAKLNQIAATGERIEAGNIAVAEDLAAAHKRAEEAESSEAGAAADAAALNPAK